MNMMLACLQWTKSRAPDSSTELPSTIGNLKKWKKIPQPKTSYKDHICYEVKYNPANKDSDSYKLYIKPFSHSMAEQWLKFIEQLNIVIHGSGQWQSGVLQCDTFFA
jgi:hypothetical protein